MLRDVLEMQRKLQPDVLETLGKRYRILQYIRLMQPIGRRTLATQLSTSERVLRSETDFLKQQGLILIQSAGMLLTEEGNKLLEGLEHTVKYAFGLEELERKLSGYLSVPKVIVVSGDSDELPVVKKELGRATVQQMKNRVSPGDVIAVAGGTTLASAADMMVPDAKWNNTIFVPARGGLGEKVEIQANTISSAMAMKAQASYRLLHVPDQLSEDTRRSLMQEPGVQEVLALLKSASLVVHGIGEAKTMAGRRTTSASLRSRLEEESAVAESFGYYVNQDGKVVHRENTVGLQWDELRPDQTVITVAGGSSKAKAIDAYMRYRPSSILITDEGAAKAILNQSDAPEATE
ncbi:central glycolytic genes regulator [Marinococcus luteus]|uniref:Central glycolytic genes regulator n=1 Tax=Marinococcus luteus TaxID=1122204 RepID=A0A1H2XH72_9BACI|nr:sugar-binding domain-containing protein [Marinococcus luteus]SDW92136.1 central glycolytic genes regulator [Marinococcus luteus]